MIDTTTVSESKNSAFRKMKEKKGKMSVDEFDSIYGDLPDGAYFARASEMGVDFF
mgnify:CR=1 FL=1